MANRIARINYKDNESSFTNSWNATLLIETENGLVDDENIRVELDNKTQSYCYSDGDIVNLKQLQSWGWAVGMMKAKSTKSRKYN